MKKLDRKLIKFLETYDGEPVSVKAVCKALNIAEGTLYNNKKYLEEKGIKFSHGSKGKSTRKTKTVEYNNISTLPVSKTLFKQVVNFVHESLSLPVAFVGCPTKVYKLGAHFSLCSAKAYIQRCMESGTLAADEVFAAIRCTIELDNLVKVRLTDEDRNSITESFSELLGLTPTEEQVRAVFLMTRQLLKGDKYTYVQAKAGSSKTTCTNVVRYHLKKNHNITLKVVSYTQLASSELRGGSTLHSLLNYITGINVLKLPEESLLAFLEDSLTAGVIKPLDRLCVDEYTTLSKDLLRATKLLCKNIVFVGDKAQFCRNNESVGTRLCSLEKQYRFIEAETSLQEDVTKATFKKDHEEVDRLLKSASLGTFGGKLRYKKAKNSCIGYIDYFNSFTEFGELFNFYRDTDSIILAYSTNAVDAINHIMNGGSEIKRGSKVATTVGIFKPFPIPSGSTGTVLTVNGDLAKVVLKDAMVDISLEQLKLVYATTSLSAQGSSWDHVLYVRGTSPKSFQPEEDYVAPTRAKVSVRTIDRVEIDSTAEDVLGVLNLQEGMRNNTLFKTLASIKDLAEDSGLASSEISKVVTSAFSAPVKTKVVKEVTKIEAKDSFSYTLEVDGRRIYAKSHQKNKTRGEAESALNEVLKSHPEMTGFVTQNLKGQPYVVFDFDSKEGVDKFKHLLDQTRGCINSEGTSMHLWFEVNTLYPTIHYAQRGGKPLDLLGNTNETNVDFKPNKPYNNLKPMALTEELFNTFNDYGNSK